MTSASPVEKGTEVGDVVVDRFPRHTLENDLQGQVKGKFFETWRRAFLGVDSFHRHQCRNGITTWLNESGWLLTITFSGVQTRHNSRNLAKQSSHFRHIEGLKTWWDVIFNEMTRLLRWKFLTKNSVNSVGTWREERDQPVQPMEIRRKRN